MERVFHDITAGNNQQTCATGTPDCAYGYLGFYAGTGYDLASGLGSVDAYNFAEQWFGDFTVSASPNTLTLQPGSSTTATVTLAPQNNFSGNVTVTCAVASVLVDVTCSVPATGCQWRGRHHDCDYHGGQRSQTAVVETLPILTAVEPELAAADGRGRL